MFAGQSVQNNEQMLEKNILHREEQGSAKKKKKTQEKYTVFYSFDNKEKRLFQSLFIICFFIGVNYLARLLYRTDAIIFYIWQWRSLRA